MADDTASLTAVIQKLAADYSHSDVRLVAIEGTKLLPHVLAAATGHRGIAITCVGVARLAAVLSHGYMDDAGLNQLQDFAARAGAWLVATGQATDIKGQGSADCLWWTALHYMFAEWDQKAIENQTVWVHDPLLRSLELMAMAAAEDVPQTSLETRAKFCFESWQSGKTHKEINAALKRHPEWEHYSNDIGVRRAINSWGKRIGVEPRMGQPGRRPK